MRASIQWNPATGNTELWLFEDGESGSRRVAAPLDLEFRTAEPGEPCEPTLRIESRLFAVIARAVLEEHRRQVCGPTVDPQRITGELDATRRHLEDVRAWFDLALRTVLAAPRIETQ